MQKEEEGRGDLSKEKSNLRKGVVFITPNNKYYRNKNLGFGWAITHETKTELTWGEDVKEESESLIELIGGGKVKVRAAIAKRAEEIEKQFEGDEEGLRRFLRRPIVGDIDHRFDGLRCKASNRGGVCSAKKREFEYISKNPNQGTWMCKDCGRLYSEEELLDLRVRSEKEEVEIPEGDKMDVEAEIARTEEAHERTVTRQLLYDLEGE